MPKPRSKAQVRYMFARHPKMAKKMVEEYGIPKGLPEKKHPGMTVRRKKRGSSR